MAAMQPAMSMSAIALRANRNSTTKRISSCSGPSSQICPTQRRRLLSMPDG